MALPELTTKLLNEIIQNFNYACDFARENDPNEARSLTSIKNVLDGIKSYEEEAKERLKNRSRPRQRGLLDFFSPK